MITTTIGTILFHTQLNQGKKTVKGIPVKS